jgi:hypothetical protein
VNNFGIYCCNDAKMNCYLWSEYDGQKTADEIISTLWIYLQKNQPIIQKKFIIWENNCCAQNTCWKTLKWNCWLLDIGSFKKTVIKTFVSGHIFTICDVYFDTIENSSFKKNFYQQ